MSVSFILKSHPFYISVLYWFLCVPGFISRLSLLLQLYVCGQQYIFTLCMISVMLLPRKVNHYSLLCMLFLPILDVLFFFHVIFGLRLFQDELHWKSDRICIKYTCISYGKIGISVIVNLLSEKLMYFSLWVF